MFDCPSDNVWWIWLSGLYIGNSANPTGNFNAGCPGTISSRALSGWDWVRTVYIRAVDKLWNTWTDFSGSITVDSWPPQVGTAVIYSWTTGNVWSTLYYKWMISIWAPVSDTLAISWATCEYTTWVWRAAAVYSGTSTAWYCLQTGLNYTSDITINFRVRDVASNLWTGISTTYVYDNTSPMIIFTWSNPVNNTTGVTNNFTGQMQIAETGIWLSQFIYTRNTTQYSVYDSGLLLMYNFDNVSTLWENSSTVKDVSRYNNTGTVNGAITWVGKYNWSYVFNGSSNYIRTLSWLTTTNWITVGAWINPKNSAYRTLLRIWDQVWTTWFHWLYLQNNITWQYTNGTNAISKSASYTFTPDIRYHILVSHDYTNKTIKYYVNGILVGTQIHVDTALPIANKQTTIWAYVSGDWPFSWSIDEVRIYNHVLSTWEIDLLYRSNLNKFNTGQWLFTDNRMCMVNGTYNYTWYVSDLLTNNYTTGRTYGINITGYGFWLDAWILLWTVNATGVSQTLSGQFTWYLWVQDDRGTTWWRSTISLPIALSWLTYPSHAIAQSNIGFYGTWWITTINWTSTPSVSISSWTYISWGVTGYVTFTTPINYIIRDTTTNQYSCPTGKYGNKPWMKAIIPAYQNPDTYSGMITIDMQ
jgi:hypothetical protein